LTYRNAGIVLVPGIGYVAYQTVSDHLEGEGEGPGMQDGGNGEAVIVSMRSG
jgi:hypothetical protein